MTTTETGTTFTVPMPTLGENVTEGTVTRWLKQPGDPISVDEPLLEVATDKVDTEIPSPVAGTLQQILASEDDVVEIGGALALIAIPSPTPEPVPDPPTASPPVDAQQPPAIDIVSDTSPTSTPTTSGAAKSTALTELSQEPSEPAETATQPGPPSEGENHDAGRVEKLPRIRRTIAARMVQSLQTSAQLTTVVEVNISAIDRLRREHKDDFLRRTGHKLSYLPFFVKAAVEALADNPVINSSLNPDVTEVTYHRGCHLGMAVDSEKGLMVPVIRDAQNLTITGLAQGIANAAERVRTGKIGADELSGGTFTITNTGSRGALFDTPIINQPQSAILGTGTVVERLAPVYDAAGNLAIEVQPTVFLSISYDHRIVDGADAARYLGAVKDRLEQGYSHAHLT